VSTIAALVALPGPAEAKYNACNGHGWPWLAPVGPAPRNMKLWLGDLEDLAGAELRIRGPGVDRLLTTPMAADYLDLGLLPAHATYELSVPALGGWVAGRFTTGGAPDHAPPRAPRIRGLAIAHPSDREHAAADDRLDQPEAPDWGFHQANDLALELDLSEDTAVLDVTVADGVGVVHRVVWRDDLGSLGRSSCAPWHHLRVGANACVTVRPIDLAGNVGAPATACTTVRDRPGDSRQVPLPQRKFPAPHEPAPAPAPGPPLIAAIAACLAPWLARFRLCAHG